MKRERERERQREREAPMKVETVKDEEMAGEERGD